MSRKSGKILLVILRLIDYGSDDSRGDCVYAVWLVTVGCDALAWMVCRSVVSGVICFLVSVLTIWRVLKGCEREVAEAANGDSEERKNESIMRLSWALVHSRQKEDVQRGIAMLESTVNYRIMSWSAFKMVLFS